MTTHSTDYECPPDPGHSRAEWDGGHCPRCGSGTLVSWVKGTAYRHCSFVECDWGLGGHDVVVGSNERVRNNDCQAGMHQFCKATSFIGIGHHLCDCECHDWPWSPLRRTQNDGSGVSGE